MSIYTLIKNNNNTSIGFKMQWKKKKLAIKI